MTRISVYLAFFISPCLTVSIMSPLQCLCLFRLKSPRRDVWQPFFCLTYQPFLFLHLPLCRESCFFKNYSTTHLKLGRVVFFLEFFISLAKICKKIILRVKLVQIDKTAKSSFFLKSLVCDRYEETGTNLPLRCSNKTIFKIWEGYERVSALKTEVSNVNKEKLSWYMIKVMLQTMR